MFHESMVATILDKLVAKNLKICFLKMLYFLNLEGCEMQLFGLVRLKPFVNLYIPPLHPPSDVGGC